MGRAFLTSIQRGFRVSAVTWFLLLALSGDVTGSDAPMALESAFCPVLHNNEFVSASKQSLGDSRVTQGQSTRAFCFSSSEGQEPPHVHVSKGDGTAKLWLVPVELAYTQGLTPAELRRVRELMREHASTFVERWHEVLGR